MNHCVAQFKYLGSDANNNPCEVNPLAEELSGLVLIGDNIVKPGDSEILQLILQLREIVDLICASAISGGVRGSGSIYVS